MFEDLEQEQAAILTEFNFKESDIPLTHVYWKNKSRLMNLPRFPALVAKKEVKLVEAVEEPKPYEPVAIGNAAEDFEFLTKPKEE